MRVKIEGTNVEPERIGEVMADVIARSPMGSTLQWVNPYFTIRDERGTIVVLTDEKGKAIDVLTYRESRSKVAVRDPSSQSKYRKKQQEQKQDRQQPKLAVVKPFVRPPASKQASSAGNTPPQNAA